MTIKIIKPALFVSTILFFIILIGLTLPVWAAPEADPGINKVYFTTVRDNSLEVSWTTDVASNGIVRYGTSSPPTTELADPTINTTTHFVTLTGLTPSTTYFIEVQSDTAVDNNGGTYYQVTTGPTLGIAPGGGVVYGKVYESNGTSPVANGIVYIQLQDTNETAGNSQWVSVRTDNNGEWGFNLPTVRTSDLSAYFGYTTGTDNMRLVYQCGDKGTLGETGSEIISTIPTADPANLGSVSCDNVPTAITMKNFTITGTNSTLYPVVLGIVGLILIFALIIWRRLRYNHTSN